MRKNGKIAGRFAVIAVMAALTVGSVPAAALAYGEEVDVSTSTFKSDTDNSTEFQTWRNDVWNAGASADSGKIALTPGRTESDLNFAWYSETKAVPAVQAAV